MRLARIPKAVKKTKRVREKDSLQEKVYLVPFKQTLSGSSSCNHDNPIRLEVADIPKQNQSDFEEFKHNTDTDGSFAAIVHGNKALRVSYTWVVQRGFE